MGRPTNAERAARAAAQADDIFVEGDDILEPFEQPVPVVDPDAPVRAGMATVRVLPKGAGKIATGHYDRAANVFSYYEKGEHLCIPLTIARAQEDNGYVEIVNGG